MDKKGKKEPDNPSSDKVPDDLEEIFTNSNCGPELEVNANPPGDEIDINHDNINQAEAAAAAEAVEEANNAPQADAAPLVGDEIDLLHPPVLDFHHLDNALQHVQGHMDTMMHNLGGLQSSVKHLKHNLNQFCVSQKSQEAERNAMRLSLHSDILQSWKDGNFSDLTLVDDAGCEHKVHKVVLAARSPYFRAQLTNWDKDKSVLEIKIVSSEILKIVLNFIYTLEAQAQINNQNVVDLLQAANIYDLKLLREECVMFLKQRISAVNIIEILSFSHIDFSLEIHASDFLARNFSTFLSSSERKMELLELPVDKMKLVLNSKLLVLRDEQSFPLKAVVREANILEFVLEYITHREAARLKHAGTLLSLVRFHLLPLNSSLLFSPDRFLPDSVLQLMATKLAAFPETLRLLKQTEVDVKTLHCLNDPAQLYQQTTRDHKPPSSSTSSSTSTSTSTTSSSSSSSPRLAERHSNWEPSLAREASVCHEWWTAHGHDSRFVPLSNNISHANLKIIAVSGAAGPEKFLRKITFYMGDVNDNNDLLPEWFNLAPQYGMNNLELGEYIGALHVIWSDGKENRIGEHGDLKRGVSVSLDQGEHIIKTYQLSWGPKHVFVPLEIVDFIFVTNQGRKFGPFTKQVRKSFEEGDVSRKEPWSHVSHKLNCRKISRKVDSPMVPMCRPDTISDLSHTMERMEDDTNWASWLDGFLCVTKRAKIVRITLKFAVYLDCFYQEKKTGAGHPPVLYNYTLKDLKENVKGRPIKIHDQDYLWDNMMTPYTQPEEEDKGKSRKRHLWNEYLIGLDNAIEMGPMGPGGVGSLDFGLPVPVPVPMIPIQPPAAQAEENGNNNNNNENLQPPNVLVYDPQEEQVEEEQEEENNQPENPEEPNIHDHVWDALINDDLRQIGDVYERKTIDVENYLE